MHPSLLDLKINGICDDMITTHLTQLTLPYYLVKVEEPKMHTNTSSPVKINYIIAIKCIKLHWQFKEMF